MHAVPKHSIDEEQDWHALFATAIVSRSGSPPSR
jgi:hypothetical protein